MRKIELLAPGGSMESLYAAVLSGCDAIYMGGSKFSARAYANNFDDEKLKEAVDYCHIYNVKVYLAVNTLIKEFEFEEAIEYVKFLYEVGVDALIIQDLGLFYAIKKLLPDFEVHASTQMTIHNGEAALFFKNLGFKRIVLSRELSLKEIEYISKNLGIETEIFIHGALCVSYSGQCLMSSIIGGRSGNRGRCAQPCRLPYTLINKVSKETREGYLLSPKDICTFEDIKKIIESGTSSLKIEGRMKRPEYVAGVVSSYKKAVDAYYGNNDDIDIKYEYGRLAQLFNREGFSKAYMFGNVGKDMMAYNFPKNTGVCLGKAEKDLMVKLEEDIHLKDGVRIGEGGFTVSGIRIGKKEVQCASKGDKVILKPSRYKEGDILYKTSDIELSKELSNIYENVYSKKLLIDAKVEFAVDKPIKITTNYKGTNFVVEGDLVQKAIKRPLDKENIVKNLQKLGDTPFQFNNIEFITFEEGFVPVSAINLIRRNLTDKILNFIKESYRRKDKLKLNISDIEKQPKKAEIPELLVIVSSLQQLKATLDNGIENIVVDFFFKGSEMKIEEVKNYGEFNLYLKIPNIIKEEFETVCEFINKNLKIIKGIVTSNLGIISRFKGKISIIGDYKLNIFNSYSGEFYNQYLDGASISVELNNKEINSIVKNTNIASQIIVYGKYELMVSEYCVIGSTFGGKSVCSNCNINCAKGDYVLKDRKGEEFKVLTDKYCRSHIFNNVPVNLIPNIKELKKNNIKSFRVDFIDEDYNKTKEILDIVKSEDFSGDYTNFTRGHYKRGVE
ncbi:U32 family peptidase [Clostridium faecium]